MPSTRPRNTVEMEADEDDIRHPGEAYTAQLKSAPTIAMERRQQRFLSLLANGCNVREACSQLSLDRKTYEKWRNRYPWFKAQCDSIRSQHSTPEAYEGSSAMFRKQYFGMDSAPFQVEMCDIIERAPESSITLILLPPEHGKTTTVQDWICQQIAKDPNIRIGYISKAKGHAQKVIGRIKRRMTDVTIAGDYIARFGPFYLEGQEKMGKPWAQQYITVNKANHDENEYTLEALGWKSQIYGSRFDIIVIDDPQDIESLGSTEKILDKITQECITRIGTHGKIVIIMTRIGQRDVARELIDRDIIDPGQLIMRPVINTKGEILWKERYSQEWLDKTRKRVTERVWWRAYMMRPQDDGTASFDERMLDSCKSDQAVIGKYDQEEYPGLVASCDPALVGGCALGVWAYNAESIRLVDCEVRYDMARNENIFAFLGEYALRYGFQDLVFESVGFQKGLADDDRVREMQAQYGFHIHQHLTNVNKINEAMGVTAMASSFMRREFVIPWGDEQSARRMEQWIAEMLSWRAGVPTRFITQDLVMMTWFAWKWWMEKRKAYGYNDSIEAQFDFRGSPFGASGSPLRRPAIHVASSPVMGRHY